VQALLDTTLDLHCVQAHGILLLLILGCGWWWAGAMRRSERLRRKCASKTVKKRDLPVSEERTGM